MVVTRSPERLYRFRNISKKALATWTHRKELSFIDQQLFALLVQFQRLLIFSLLDLKKPRLPIATSAAPIIDANQYFHCQFAASILPPLLLLLMLLPPLMFPLPMILIPSRYCRHQCYHHQCCHRQCYRRQLQQPVLCCGSCTAVFFATSNDTRNNI